MPGYNLALDELPAVPNGYEWYGVVSFSDHLIALGKNDTTFVTAKLGAGDSSWTLGTPITDAVFTGFRYPKTLARTSGGVYASQVDGGNKILTGNDGLSWSLVTPDYPTPVSVVDYYGIGAVGNTFYVAGLQYTGGSHHTQLYSSANLTNWTLLSDVVQPEWQPTRSPSSCSCGMLTGWMTVRSMLYSLLSCHSCS